MRTIVSCGQMRELDRYTIQEQKLASGILMERAALAVVEQLEREEGTLGRVLVVCGAGNNGGDGVAVGRLLHLKGYRVELYCLGDFERYSPDLRLQLEIAGNYRVPLVNNPRWSEYTTIVDAIFGVGLTREVAGSYRETILQMNETSARKVAVDIPSGLDGDSGQVLGCAVRADETVTFAFLKKGLCLYPGCEYAGEIRTADIGIYEKGWEETADYIHALEDGDVAGLLPRRKGNGNKGTFGKVLFVAGSSQMAGAAYLSASACLHSGAGMVKIHTPEENRVILQSLLPEALLSTYREEEREFGQLRDDLKWADVVVAGPGLGQGDLAGERLQVALKCNRKPLVLDADGLNLFSRHPHWGELLPQTCVFTPHLMEMTRLTGETLSRVQQDLAGQAGRFAHRNRVICVLKDARTVVAAPDGRKWLNLSGNSGMATAGSGDVLSGMVAALLAGQGEPAQMAALAVYLHGRAGDVARKKKGSRSMTAQDLITALPEVLR